MHWVRVLYCLCMFNYLQLTLSVCAWRWSCNLLYGSIWCFRWS